jgi:hypothetical protein
VPSSNAQVVTWPFFQECVGRAVVFNDIQGRPANPLGYQAASEIQNGPRENLPRACAVETDADRPFFMHGLE